MTATGHFLADKLILIDNRTHDGVAGYHVLMPLKLDEGGRTILVLRGWIGGDPVDRSRWPVPATPTGSVTVRGWFEKTLPQPIQLAKDPVPGPADRVWLFFSFDKYRTWSQLAVDDAVIRQTSALDDGLVRDWTPSGPGASTHYGYAFQWYAMAVATALLWLWYRRPRRDRAPAAAEGSPSAAGDVTSGGGPPAAG